MREIQVAGWKGTATLRDRLENLKRRSLSFSLRSLLLHLTASTLSSGNVQFAGMLSGGRERGNEGAEGRERECV
eukprot:879930-Pleurochrysis_carterae.AAC.1